VGFAPVSVALYQQGATRDVAKRHGVSLFSRRPLKNKGKKNFSENLRILKRHKKSRKRTKLPFFRLNIINQVRDV